MNNAQIDQLCLLAQAGDSQALSSLHLYFGPRIKRFARSYVGGHFACLSFLASIDATNEVISHLNELLVRSATDFQPELGIPFAKAFFARARFELLTASRKERIRRTRETFTEELTDSGHGRAIPTSDPYAASDIRIDVQTALAKLPEREARAVQLTLIEGFTESEAANQLDTTQQRVSDLKAKALGRLRFALAS